MDNKEKLGKISDAIKSQYSYPPYYDIQSQLDGARENAIESIRVYKLAKKEFMEHKKIEDEGKELTLFLNELANKNPNETTI